MTETDRVALFRDVQVEEADVDQMIEFFAQQPKYLPEVRELAVRDHDKPNKPELDLEALVDFLFDTPTLQLESFSLFLTMYTFGRLEQLFAVRDRQLPHPLHELILVLNLHPDSHYNPYKLKMGLGSNSLTYYVERGDVQGAIAILRSVAPTLKVLALAAPRANTWISHLKTELRAEEIRAIEFPPMPKLESIRLEGWPRELVETGIGAAGDIGLTWDADGSRRLLTDMSDNGKAKIRTFYFSKMGYSINSADLTGYANLETIFQWAPTAPLRFDLLPPRLRTVYVAIGAPQQLERLREELANRDAFPALVEISLVLWSAPLNEGITGNYNGFDSLEELRTALQADCEARGWKTEIIVADEETDEE